MARILVVEDSQELRDLVSLVLEDEGYLVTAVRTLDEARQAIHRASFDLIVSDLTEELPDGPGAQDSAWLLEARLAAPVLVLTGRSWASISSADELGVHGLIAKPFDLDQLLATVAAFVRVDR